MCRKVDTEICLRVVVIERHRLGLPPERLAKPPVFHSGQMLNQTKQAGARGNHHQAKLFVVEVGELPEHYVAVSVERRPQRLLLSADEGHLPGHD